MRHAFEHVNKIRDTVAYRGHIDPSNISHESSWTLSNVPKDPSSDEYFKAIDTMRVSERKGNGQITT